MTLKSDAKLEEKLTCALKNIINEYGKFSTEHLKYPKLGLWWGPFIKNRKCMNSKFTVICHDNEE